MVGASRRVEIDKIGFMPLKKLLVEHGVPKEAVDVPNKHMLEEVAAKYNCKIEFVHAAEVS